MRCRAIHGLSLMVVGILASDACLAAEPVTIGYSAFALNTSFLSTFAKQIQAQGKAAGFNVQEAVANGDAAKQASDVNTLVTSGVKGLLIDPVDADAIVPVIKRAVARGVKVVPVDGAAAGGPVSIQVATDNYGAGAKACEIIAEAIGKKGTVLNLQGDLANIAGRNRSNGFTECMAKSYPNVTVVSKAFNWDSARCAQIAQTQLTTSKIDGVFSAAAQCLTPVMTVLKTTNRLAKVGEPGHVPFVEIDGTPEDADAVREGYLDASISQPLTAISKYGAYWLKRAIAGESIKAGPTDHGTTVVEAGGTLHDLVAPIVVTKANVEDPNLWANQK